MTSSSESSQPQEPTSLCDALDQILDVGVAARGDIMISVANIDLLYLGLQLVLSGVDKAGVETLLPHSRSGFIPTKTVPGAKNKIESLKTHQQTQSNTGVGSRLHIADKKKSMPTSGSKNTLDSDPQTTQAEQLKDGLGQLVLTLVKLLHELLQKQALRRIESGKLSEDEIEDLGIAFMNQAEEIKRLCQIFGLDESDLNIDLGPLGKLL